MKRIGPTIITPARQILDAGPRPNLLAEMHNDYGNARRLIALHGNDMRYCHAMRKWLVWDARRWCIDITDRAERLAKLAMSEFYRQAVDARAGDAEKFARGCLDQRRIASMLAMAQSEEGIYITPDQLDQDPYALNFLNGTVDLRTGGLRPHGREDYITKLVHYAYRPGSARPTWMQFLNQIMGGGPDADEDALKRAQRLIDYLQRALGYSLTARTIEKAVFVLYGAGDNGKTTLLTTFRRLIEEYAVLLQVDTLMVRQESNNSQADLADLRGARFVQTSEAEEGQRLAQGKLKRITQGMGTIKSVRKYENPIEFRETHKVWMDTNHRPTIRDADDPATFNRLHPIPFLVRIPKEQIDKDLPAKLLAEAEGILAWAVEGAVEWHKQGLDKPNEVETATKQWRDDMDQIGRFLEERCDRKNATGIMADALYTAYKRWCEDSGERHILTSKALSQKLTGKGYASTHKEAGTLYEGISLQKQANFNNKSWLPNDG